MGDQKVTAAQDNYNDLLEGKAPSREKIIVRTSLVGIAVNIVLAAVKAGVGLLANSIAIVLDAVNNLSDAASSIITLIGIRLAGKEADKKHPWGHGRVEYISEVIIAALVLYAGITSLVESVKKILDPGTPSYSLVTLVLVAVGIVAKLLLGAYVTRKGHEANSDALVDSGKDATMDATITGSTLVAALLYLWQGWKLEAILGAIISLIIIKSGVEMVRDAISKILGERTDIQVARDVRGAILEEPGVHGAYDLLLNDYGPSRFTGSVHIEVDEDISAVKIDEMTRRITENVYAKTGVILTAVGIYATNLSDPEWRKHKSAIAKVAFGHKEVREVHGFYYDQEKKLMRFDVVVDFDAQDRRGVCRMIEEELQPLYPGVKIIIGLDADFTVSEA